MNDLRAADADREAVATALRRAHGEGRLDTDELEERLERCYAAKTLADLDRLVSDLPRPAAPRRRSRPTPAFLAPLALLVLALAVVTHGHVLFVVPLLVVFVARFTRPRRGARW